jgi:hypothetical protein
MSHSPFLCLIAGLGGATVLIGIDKPLGDSTRAIGRSTVSATQTPDFTLERRGWKDETTRTKTGFLDNGRNNSGSGLILAALMTLKFVAFFR